MAELQYIECVEKSKLSVTLNVYLVHQDESEFYQKKNYALQLIWSPANPALNQTHSLGTAIPLDLFFNTAWINKHCSEFIESVKIIETKNYPVPENLSFNRAMARLNELPMAVFLITVTHPKWIEHIKQDANWRSAAYDYGGI
jgi:hypothetical protein